MIKEKKRNPELRTAWDFVEHTGHSIFLTGKAGTGKTTFLKTVVERSSKRSIVVAPTGVAAINAGGVTIHSFFQLPFSPYIPNTRIKSDYKFSNEKRRIIASLDLLIIDEISMVRADLLDAVDSVLRRFRDWRLPFGGLQLLMIGDLGQLTPVTTPEEDELLKQYYETPYFFSSQALSKINYVTIQLETVYRQQDALFLGILNNIREDKATDRDLAILNQRYIPRFVPDKDGGYIRLTTHNHFANHYNESELGKLSSEAFTYNAFVEGDFPDYSFPTSEVLTLKEGAQVMFIKNDTSEDHLYYNGRIGQVVFANAHKVVVRCTNPEQNIEVTPQEWENTKYTLNDDTHEIEPTVLGKFRQLPLRLAWAITIHKSQGLTFDHAIIDASLSFAPGQVYVALSRCRTLEGMVLASPLTQKSIICDDRVNNYISHQEEEARRSIGQLTTLKESYFQKLLIELFQFRKLQSLEERMLRLLQEYFYNRFTQINQMHKQLLESLKQDVITIAGQWTLQLQQSSEEALHSEELLARVQRSCDYFHQKILSLFEKPLALSAEVKSDNKQAMKRYTETLTELQQTWNFHLLLLEKMSTRPFSIATYLKEKDHALLKAMDEKPKRKRVRKNRTYRDT